MATAMLVTITELATVTTTSVAVTETKMAATTREMATALVSLDGSKHSRDFGSKFVYNICSSAQQVMVTTTMEMMQDQLDLVDLTSDPSSRSLTIKFTFVPIAA